MATKYVSALDGQQMDAALTDMAYHNSEAWAVGTRNGQAVSSGDVTYHNNAKYYSDKVSTDTQRAEDAAARAEAAVPAGTAGAVFFDRAQSLTTAQQMQAKANILAGGTNPSLLDNPWWGSGEVINQRGLATYSGSGAIYTVDRWQRTSNPSLTVNVTSGGLKFTLTSNGSWTFFNQYMGRVIDQEATYTFSIMDDAGTIYSATRKFVSGTSSESYITIGGMSLGLGLYGKGSKPFVSLGFGPNRAGEFTIRAIKLELGSVSTLANDAPPDYGTELAKCQRYFVRVKGDPFGTGYITSSGSGSRITIPTSVPMRGQPSVSFSGTFHLRVQGGTLSVTAMSSPTPVNTAGGITLSCTGFTGAPVGYCALYADGINDYIDFSADL